MDFASWLEFGATGEIRIRGTRVSLATIAREYERGASAEEIAQNYPTVTLEQVYASILFLLTHPAEARRSSALAPDGVNPPSPLIERVRAARRQAAHQARTAP